MSLVEKSSNSLAELERSDLKSLDTHELKQLLSAAVSVTAQYIQFIARVWHELESRGEDLSELRSGLMRYLPLVHDGKLDASVVISFAGQQLLLREIALMPVEEQKRLAGGEKIPLVTQNAAGDFSTAWVDVKTLHARHYGQVFNMGEVRTEQEQIAILSKPAQRKRRNQKVRRKKVYFERDVFRCGQTKILAEDVLDALSGISGKPVSDIRDFLGIKPNHDEKL